MTPYVQPLLESPVFSNFNYTSSAVPTQYTDAVQRAAYYKRAKPDWHTMLAASVKTARTMTLIRGTYRFLLNPDGSCCLFVVIDFQTFANEFYPAPTTTFPPDSSSLIGAAEAAGDMTTKDITTWLFPESEVCFDNTFTFCFLGYHDFDIEPGDSNNGFATRVFVENFTTWDNPQLFDPATYTADVTTVSHELAETFNDPFYDGIHGITPWYFAPNGFVCQDVLEVGDVLEFVPGYTYPITMPNGTTYHPQNVALLPWFEFESPSSALGGAYSYPDTSLLTTLSAPQKANCAP